MRRSLYCHKTFSRWKLIPITQITSKSQYPSELPSQQKWHTPGCPNLKIMNCSLYTRGFSVIDCKLNMDGSLSCCIYLYLTLCIIRVLTRLYVLIMNLYSYPNVFQFIFLRNYQTSDPKRSMWIRRYCYETIPKT